MAVRVGEIMRGVRERHPSFTKNLVPDPVLLRFLSEYQGDLALMAFEQDDMFMAQQASIAIVSDAENARGSARANSGGFPAAIDDDGNIGIEDADAGLAIEFDFKSAQRLVEPLPVYAADAYWTLFNAPGWADNVYAGAVARIVAGPGIGQARVVQSNTADTLWFATPWDTPPQSGSMIEVVIVEAGLDDTVFSVATIGQPRGERRGYLVRLDAQGMPYLDMARPIVATFGKGIPLPPNLRIIGATVGAPSNSLPGTFRKDGPTIPEQVELNITSYHDRFHARYPSAHIMGNELFLTGDSDAWPNGLTLDLRYVPIPPAFSSVRDYVFVPGSDRALREAGAQFCAERLAGMNVPGVDATRFINARTQAEALFVQGILSRDMGYTFVTRDVSPY